MFASSTVSFVPGSKAITFFRQLFRISKDSGCPVCLYQAKVNNWSLLHVVPDTHRDTNSTLVVQLLHTTVVSLWSQQRHRDPTCHTCHDTKRHRMSVSSLQQQLQHNTLTMTCRQACCRSCFWNHWKRLQPDLSPTGVWALTQHQTLELGMEGLRLQVKASLVCKTSYQTTLALSMPWCKKLSHSAHKNICMLQLNAVLTFDGVKQAISLFGYH